MSHSRDALSSTAAAGCVAPSMKVNAEYSWQAGTVTAILDSAGSSGMALPCGDCSGDGSRPLVLSRVDSTSMHIQMSLVPGYEHAV